MVGPSNIATRTLPPLSRRLLPVALRSAWGAVLVIAPHEVLAGLDAPARPPAAGIVRVLGARNLLQASAVLIWRSERAWRGGELVDAVHAVSMLGLAIASRPYRRAALVSATVAAGLVAIELRAEAGLA